MRSSETSNSPLRRSARLARAAATVLTPAVLGGASAFAQRPALITSITEQNNDPLAFYVYWETTTAYGLAMELYGAEDSTYDNDALDLGPTTFLNGYKYIESGWYDVPQWYEFFIGTQDPDGNGVDDEDSTATTGDGYHSQWMGIYAT